MPDELTPFLSAGRGPEFLAALTDSPLPGSLRAEVPRHCMQ